MKISKFEKKFVNSKWQARRNIKIVEKLLGQIDLSDVKKVLEAGCGIGVLASYLAGKYKWEVTGIDLDSEQIERAKKDYTENEHLRFLEADTTELPFEDNEFDMVLSFDVLHHIPCWDKAVEEISRVLKQKGFYILEDLSTSNSKILKRLFKNYFGVFTADSVRRDLKRNHFKILYEEIPKIIMNHFRIVSQKNN
jgi:ubiquinone/menaquinone biosynthesis C-methylase UbiE